MRKDVRLGLAIGGSAMVVVACSVLFFRNPDIQPDPQAGRSGGPTPSIAGAAAGTAPGGSVGAGLADTAPVLPGGAGSISFGPAAPGGNSWSDPGLDTIAGSIGGPGGPGAGPAGDPIRGFEPIADTGTGRRESPAWGDLLEHGGNHLLAHTTTPTTPPTTGVGAGGPGSLGGGPGFTSSADATSGWGSTPSTGSSMYTVQQGDTYWTIAQREYGNGGYFSHLVRANPTVPPNRLRPSLQIIIPDRSQVIPDSAQPRAALASTLDPRIQYRVESGDNLHNISKKLYGTTDKVTKLYQLNRELIGPNPGALKVNMVLQLPDPPLAADAGASAGMMR
jgi:nucleoid-associated protein YgaU